VISNCLNEKLSDIKINGVQTFKLTMIRKNTVDDAQSMLKGAKQMNIIRIGKILQFRFTKVNEILLLDI